MSEPSEIMRRNVVAYLTALSFSRVIGQLDLRLNAPRVTRACV